MFDPTEAIIAEFGHLGTEDEPIEMSKKDAAKRFAWHQLQHVHFEGKCIRNRWEACNVSS